MKAKREGEWEGRVPPSPPCVCPVGVGVVEGVFLCLRSSFYKFHTNEEPKALGICLKFEGRPHIV